MDDVYSDKNKLLFLRTNEYIEALNSLKKVTETLDQVDKNIYEWKWAIISMHNCVQCFMVIALRGTAGFQISKKPEKLLDIKSENQLIHFMDLYKKIKREKSMHQFSNSKVFIEDITHFDAMQRLNCLRNLFIHYFPVNFSLRICDLFYEFRDILDIVKFLFYDSGNVQHHYNEEQIKQINEYINMIDSKLCYLINDSQNV